MTLQESILDNIVNKNLGLPLSIFIDGFSYTTYVVYGLISVNGIQGYPVFKIVGYTDSTEYIASGFLLESSRKAGSNGSAADVNIKTDYANTLLLLQDPLIEYDGTGEFGINILETPGLQLYLNKDLGVNSKLAASFTGVGESFAGAGSYDLSTRNVLSGSFWFNRRGTTKNEMILGCWNVLGTPGSDKVWKILINHPSYSVSLVVTSNGTTETIAKSLGNAPLNAWSHVAFYIDKDNAEIGFSLNNANFVTASVDCYNAAEGIRIGRESGSLGQSFTGYVDSINFWSRRLTQSEVNTLYNSGDGLSYYNFDSSLLVDYYDGYLLNEAGSTRYSIVNNFTLTESTPVAYTLGKIQEPSQVGELVNTWIDQSPNMFVLSQDTVTKQPILQSGSIDYDELDDILSLTVANIFGTDTVGSIFFSGYVGALGTNQLYVTSGDTATDLYYFNISVNTSNKLRLNVSNAGVGNVLDGSTTLIDGDYFWAEFRQHGAGVRFFLNGIEETITIVSGSNPTNLWWNYVTLRDNLVLGASIRVTQIYGKPKENKLIYSNAILTDSEIGKINNFMSQP